jgi:ABC-type Fe3+-siderophore transport system permease subunit
MNRKIILPATLAGAIAFVVTFLFGVLLSASYPFGASLLVGFLIFELRYYMLWSKNRRQFQ